MMKFESREELKKWAGEVAAQRQGHFFTLPAIDQMRAKKEGPYEAQKEDVQQDDVQGVAITPRWYSWGGSSYLLYDVTIDKIRVASECGLDEAVRVHITWTGCAPSTITVDGKKHQVGIEIFPSSARWEIYGRYGKKRRRMT